MTTKENPERLSLRAAPQHRMIRFRRGLVIAAAALAAGSVLAVAMMALYSPILSVREHAEELYNVENRPMPEGVSRLPPDYSQAKPEPPRLGPPLPGDLGRPILEHQRQLGLMPAEEDISAQEQRLAQLAVKAREADVFFQLENRSQEAISIAQALQNPPSARPDAPEAAREMSSAAAVEGHRGNQQRKLDSIERRDTGGIYNPHASQKPASAYQVMAGSVIAASLVTGINSDLPGLVTAQVTENVYDTVTGSVLLIPQGSRLIGTYDSVIAFGQSRALVVWQRIIMPNGTSLEIDNLPATDAGGYTGLEDRVDFHTWRLLKGVALSTLLGVGTQLSLSGESDLIRAIRESAQQNAARAGQSITEKNLNIQPTITVRPGWPLRVIVHQDLVLEPYAD